VGVLLGRRRVMKSPSFKVMVYGRWISYTHVKPLAIVLSEVGRALRGRDDGDNISKYNISLIGIMIMNPLLYKDYILIKCIKKET
jgi:hypothetical protein